MGIFQQTDQPEMLSEMPYSCNGGSVSSGWFQRLFYCDFNGEQPFQPAGFDRIGCLRWKAVSPSPGATEWMRNGPKKTRMKFQMAKAEKTDRSLRTGFLLFLPEGQLRSIWEQQCILSDRTVPKENARLSELY